MISDAVLSQYDIGTVESVETLSSGLIHKTYRLTTDRGTFILQKLHDILSSDAVGADFAKTTSYLNAQHFLAPELVHTTSGDTRARDGEEVWRMQTCLEGRTIETIPSTDVVVEAARMFGEFHRVFDGFEYAFEAPNILHNSEKIFETFQEVLASTDWQQSELADEIAFLQDEFPKLFLPKGLPQRVVHGDPKISNVMFDEDLKAIALVDLDTCNRHTVLVELGDACRAWCGGADDEQNNTLDLERYEAVIASYLSAVGDVLTDQEKELIPQAVGLISLELATRFATDYFKDDYFGWDQTRYESRRAHNVARTRGQIALYKDAKEKLGL